MQAADADPTHVRWPRLRCCIAYVPTLVLNRNFQALLINQLGYDSVKSKQTYGTYFNFFGPRFKYFERHDEHAEHDCNRKSEHEEGSLGHSETASNLAISFISYNDLPFVNHLLLNMFFVGFQSRLNGRSS